MRILSTCILAALALALLAIVLSLTGIWKDAGRLAAVLFGLTLVLALLGIVNDSDKSAR